MTRTALTAAAALVVVGILAAVCLAGPTTGIVPTPYARVSPAAFTTLPPPASLGPVPRATVAPLPSPWTPASSRPTSKPVSHTVPPFVGAKGVATYQPLPGLFASAGPVLRALGINVGQLVRVCRLEAGQTCVSVRIWPGGCWCKRRPGGPTLLDLSELAFIQLAPLSQGVVAVEVTW